MIVSDKEKAMLAVTVVFLLFAVTGMTLRKRIDGIRALRNEQNDKAELLQSYQDLISQKGQWTGEYSKKAGMMPVFDEKQQVETHWLGILERLASTNGVTIVRRQVGEEIMNGDVYELPIECKEWEGSLEGIVGFLSDINSEGAMLDVRKLFIRPIGSNKPGLRGSFTLYCAYLREANKEDKHE